EAAKGELLIKAAQENGVYIPRFCWHERMKPVGMCRMCLVEIDGVRGFPPACTTPVAEGMVCRTESDAVKKIQDGVLEYLLINHPLDCPVCDRAASARSRTRRSRSARGNPASSRRSATSRSR